ncbi:ADP-ribosylation factor 1 [Plakobranchus ocellatus]|uniref:ADP-ribosylation factor 1 n=1 Tax=Plakobranchus ocellatus TaxID=259542 RepID=A0AAV3Z5F4_9GAST|nr:ADP-ribosylation factor 1 [Plakobranchus ocellatus]
MGNWFFKAPERRIIIQGLDAAGKTSLLYRLKLGEVVTTIPTIGFNVETINVNGLSIVCWDLGGRDKVRPLYRHYYPNTHGVVYVIDSNDRDRFDDALDELVRYVLLEDEIFNAVVMVLANKQDIPGAMTALDIQEALKEKYRFQNQSSGFKSNSNSESGAQGPSDGHTVFVRSCSVVTMEGMNEAFGEFVEQMRLKRDGKSKPGLLPLSTADEDGEKKSETKTLAQSNSENRKESFASARVKMLCKDPFSFLRSLLY